jgi:uncharacterized linocin/CFP29 family protein
MNFILNGEGHGNVANVLMANNFDTNALRPWIGDDGKSYITVNTGKVYPEVDPNTGGKHPKAGQPILNAMVINTPATLRKDEWIQLDTAIIKAAKPRLNAVADLRAAGLQYVIPNGLGKTVLQHETQSDISEATISMDGLREGESDRPQFDIANLPLPITHKDFQFSARQVMTSRNGASPIDTTTAELAGRRVAESIEKLLLGVSSSYAYGGGTVYGFRNFPSRLTKTITTPGTPATTVTEVIAMREQSKAAFYYGPWTLYYGPGWDASMDTDYSTAYPSITLRDRLMKIEGITDVKSADYLTSTDLILVQKTSDVARVVVGMDLTTLQWESHGGMQLNFKVMAIIVPQLRADYNGNTGIVHGSV